MDLETPPTIEELKSALRHRLDNKAPGPDCISQQRCLNPVDLPSLWKSMTFSLISGRKKGCVRI